MVYIPLQCRRVAGEAVQHSFLVVAIIGVIVVPFGVYEQLWSLRERQWAAEIFDFKYVRISWLMIDSLGIVFLTMIGSYALYMAWGNAGVDENITWWQKMIFGVIQIAQYGALSLIVSLYRLSGWLRDLRQEMPQPIYTNMLKLKSVVRTEVLEMLEFCDKGGGIHPEQSVNYGVLLVVKQRNKKQFYMTFGLVGGRGTALARPEDIVQREQKKQWEVITDRWGRIKSLQPKHQVVVVRAS